MEIIGYNSREKSTVLGNTRRFIGKYTLTLFGEQDTNSRLYHGSIVPPKIMGPVIYPRQAYHNNTNHGPAPGVSASSNIIFPVVRSLIHEQSPCISELTQEMDYPITLSYRKGVRVSYLFTSVYTLDTLAEHNSEGFVYEIARVVDAVPYEERADMAEWRCPAPLRWQFAYKTGLQDLPDTLLVVDGPPEARQGFFEEHQRVVMILILSVRNMDYPSGLSQKLEHNTISHPGV